MVAAVAIPVVLPTADASAAGACDPPVVNPVACENTRPGTDPGRWSFAGAGDPTIQGFATDVSVQRGTTVHFKIETQSTDYHLDIYRVGYYQGLGRAQGREQRRADGFVAADPAGVCVRPRERDDRLWQLEGVGVVGGAVHRGVGHLLRDADSRRLAVQHVQSHLLRRPRRLEPRRRPVSDVGHHVQRVQPVRREQPLHVHDWLPAGCGPPAGTR